jgi:hypothetical protein
MPIRPFRYSHEHDIELFSSHSVALEDLLTGGTEFGSILLETPLHRSVITQLLSTKAGSIFRAGFLLLRRSHMTALSEDQGAVCKEKCNNQ